MTDLVEEFKGALSELGIKYREAGQSLVIQSCPACGSDAFKVHLRLSTINNVLLGRCYSGGCQENFSSIKYLTMSGMDYEQARRVHGFDPTGSLNGLSPNVDQLLELVVTKEEEPKPRTLIDTSKFFKVFDWLEHPASKYAISRGVRQCHNVYINHAACSVVFLVTNGNEVVGYQERFVNPVAPHLKVKSSDGFKKSENLLVFENSGNILVCEGPFTAIAANNYGYHAICTFGASVSDIQISKIIDIAKQTEKEIGIAFDLDDAGIKGFNRIRSAMHWEGKEIFKVVVTGANKQGYDLSDAWKDGQSIKEIKPDWAGPAFPDLPEGVALP